MKGSAIFRVLAPRMFWLFLGIIALIEVIYVTEKFTVLMVFIIEHGGTVFDTILLSFLKTPEIVDFALPIAILIALYFAITAARESNELVICSAAGLPWTRIVRFAFLVGLLGLGLSLTFACVITPAARYAERIMTASIEATAIAREINRSGQTSAIRSIEGITFVATPSADRNTERGNLFVFEPDRGDGWRISQADDWTVVGPRTDGSHAVKMKSYRNYIGRTADQQRKADETLGTSQMMLQSTDWNVSDVSLVFRVDQLVEPVNRLRRAQERFLLPGAFSTPQNVPQLWASQHRRIAETMGRALGCVLAAMCALAIAAFATTRLGRIFAIPIGLGTVLVGDVAFQSALVGAAQTGATNFLIQLLVITAASICLPLGYVLFRREALIRPYRGQS